MNMKEMQALVGLVTYKPGWTIHFSVDTDGRPYIQVSVDETAEAARCPFTGKVEGWRGGKRYLSPYMCRQEVVGACLAAVKDAEMHEIHEWFRYRGVTIFNPHLDPDALWEVARFKRNLNIRENAMSMQEGNA